MAPLAGKRRVTSFLQRPRRQRCHMRKIAMQNSSGNIPDEETLSSSSLRAGSASHPCGLGGAAVDGHHQAAMTPFSRSQSCICLAAACILLLLLYWNLCGSSPDGRSLITTVDQTFQMWFPPGPSVLSGPHRWLQHAQVV